MTAAHGARVGEQTAMELAGFARAMREKMIVVDAGPDVIDTAGTVTSVCPSSVATASGVRSNAARRIRRRRRIAAKVPPMFSAGSGS